MAEPRGQTESDAQFIGGERAGSPSSGRKRRLVKDFNPQIMGLKQSACRYGILEVSLPAARADTVIQDVSNNSSKDASLRFKMLDIRSHERLERGRAPKAGVTQVEPTKLAPKLGDPATNMVVADHNGRIHCVLRVSSNIVNRATHQHHIPSLNRVEMSMEFYLAQPNATHSQIHESEVASLLAEQT
jgi:hypothetical protein